jgi:hypothetical protein
MGAAVAAIIIRREKDLVEHFRRAGATRPEAAQTPGALGVDDDNMIWRILVKGAVIRQGAGGGYYLDELSWEALGRRRRRMAIIMLAVVVTLGIVAYLSGKQIYLNGLSRH